jgi:hypothetical protein
MRPISAYGAQERPVSHYPALQKYILYWLLPRVSRIPDILGPACKPSTEIVDLGAPLYISPLPIYRFIKL